MGLFTMTVILFECSPGYKSILYQFMSLILNGFLPINEIIWDLFLCKITDIIHIFKYQIPLVRELNYLRKC